MSPEVRFVFRHFPLAEMHPHALAAAEAAEAAGAQGKFWEMHDMLYENQDALEPGGPGRLRRGPRAGHRALRPRVAAHTHLGKVEADFRSGVKSGVHGTPTFFIDGVRHDAGWDAPTLLSALRAAILAKAA